MQEVICKSSRLREAVASAEDFIIYLSISGGFAEVVFLYDFLRDIRELDAHMLLCSPF